jgi:hypothetical protein
MFHTLLPNTRNGTLFWADRASLLGGGILLDKGSSNWNLDLIFPMQEPSLGFGQTDKDLLDCIIIFILAILGFELRILQLLGRYSTTCATPPAPLELG